MHAQGLNWLYTEQKQVKKVVKKYAVPAHLVSLRLCGITFDQFLPAFQRYADEHLNSAAGVAEVSATRCAISTYLCHSGRVTVTNTSALLYAPA
jgi:hypothetical protein